MFYLFCRINIFFYFGGRLFFCDILRNYAWPTEPPIWLCEMHTQPRPHVKPRRMGVYPIPSWWKVEPRKWTTATSGTRMDLHKETLTRSRDHNSWPRTIHRHATRSWPRKSFDNSSHGQRSQVIRAIPGIHNISQVYTVPRRFRNLWARSYWRWYVTWCIPMQRYLDS